MMCRSYPALGSAHASWLVENLLQLFRSTTQTCLVGTSRSSVWKFYAHSSELISRGLPLMVSWKSNVISKKLTMIQCYCSTPSILDLKPFLGNIQDWCPVAKNCTLTNSAPIFAMKTMIIFMGVYPKTHTLLITALTDSSFVVFFLLKPSGL